MQAIPSTHAFTPGILVLTCLTLLLIPPTPAGATILTFDQQRDAATNSIVGPTTSGGTLPADYGDHVIAASMSVPGGVFTYGEEGEGFTPDVGVDIFSAAANETAPRVDLWQAGYGDLVNAIFAEGPGVGGAPLLSVRLTADTGYMVDLYSFDLAGFGSDYTIAGVSVFDGTTSLFSESNVLVQGDLTGPRHASFAFDQPLSATELLLVVDISNLPASIQDNIALDNLRFGQTPPGVPEPTTFTLMLNSVAILFAWRNR